MKNLLKIVLPMLLLVCFSFRVHAQDGMVTKEMIQKAYDVFNNYQFDKLGDFIDENYIEHSPDPGQKPGLAGLKESFQNLKKGFPDFKLTMNDVIINSTGDKASILFTFTGTNKGEMMGMKPTGKTVNVQGIDLMYFKNGKATEHWGYLDMNNMMAQLGMMPPPDQK